MVDDDDGSDEAGDDAAGNVERLYQRYLDTDALETKIDCLREIGSIGGPRALEVMGEVLRSGCTTGIALAAINEVANIGDRENGLPILYDAAVRFSEITITDESFGESQEISMLRRLKVAAYELNKTAGGNDGERSVLERIDDTFVPGDDFKKGKIPGLQQLMEYTKDTAVKQGFRERVDKYSRELDEVMERHRAGTLGEYENPFRLISEYGGPKAGEYLIELYQMNRNAGSLSGMAEELAKLEDDRVVFLLLDALLICWDEVWTEYDENMEGERRYFRDPVVEALRSVDSEPLRGRLLEMIRDPDIQTKRKAVPIYDLLFRRS